MDSHAVATQVEAIAFGVAGIAALLGAASLLVPVAKRIMLPYAVLLAVFGGGVGLLITAAFDFGGTMGSAARFFAETEVPSEALLYLFLPPLLFAAGLRVDVRRMLDDFWPILVLAIVAVVLCCAVVGASLLPFIVPPSVAAGSREWVDLAVLCLLIGALVAPTDTAAILSIFKDIGAPRRLSTIVEGESLFNDAAAVTLVVLLIAALAGHTSGGFVGAGGEFLRELGGGLVFGALMGLGAAAIAQLARGFMVAEITVTLALANLTFVVAQMGLNVSGIIAVVAAALVFGARARTRLTPGTWPSLLSLWTQLDFWATTLIFVFAAMEVPRAMTVLRWSDAAALAAVYAAALAARAVVSYGMFPLLSWLKLAEPVSLAYRTALTWGGVRGAVTVVLALYVVETPAVMATGAEYARLILVLAIGYVLLTLFINAPTLRLAMHWLRLDVLTPRERMVRDRVLALSRARVERVAAEAARDLGLERPAPEIDPLADTVDESVLSHDERVQVGLLALVNREAELAITALERGLIGREVAEIMLNHTGRMFDLTRSRGAQGYAEASGRNHRSTTRFRLAVWLHRRFGLTGPLAGEIALRFEVMLAKERLMRQLKRFSSEQVGPVVGASAAAEVAQIIADRAHAVETALGALAKQYPAYATMVRELLVERLALSVEEAEYKVQRDQSLISEEVFESLEGDRMKRVRALSRRPALDLGLEITDMIGRVPLFAGLSEKGRIEVARLLHSELAVQGERIIRAGTIGREMYFIVSGAVEVVVPGEPVRLKEGDFFGEVALVTSRPRNADVVAVGYCELLVLRKRDLDALLAQQPDLRDQMEQRAMSRIGAVASG